MGGKLSPCRRDVVGPLGMAYQVFRLKRVTRRVFRFRRRQRDGVEMGTCSRRRVGHGGGAGKAGINVGGDFAFGALLAGREGLVYE